MTEPGVNVPRNLSNKIKGHNYLILMALWSNPSVSSVGVTRNAVEVISNYLGGDIDLVSKSITLLHYENKIMFDSDTGEVLVPEWLENNYLIEGTIAQCPDKILADSASVISKPLRDRVTREFVRLDIGFDKEFRL